MKIGITVILILSTLATVLPVFSGYVMTFSMFLTVLLSGNKEQKPLNKESLKHWNYGIAGLLFLLAFSATVSFMNGETQEVHQLRSYIGHSIVKYGLVWWFMLGFTSKYSTKPGDAMRVLSYALGICSIFHFVYCAAQWKTGIDWVHGFSAVLPPNRFAYGFYRVSGFTSHPLSLGYQLCFVIFFGGYLAVNDNNPRNARIWAGIGACLSWLILAISGSRGPLLLSSAAILIQFLPNVFQYKKYIVPFGILIFGILINYTNIFRRFGELLSLRQSGDTRFMDWKVYTTAFLEHPVFGLGPIGFDKAILSYYQRLGGDASIGLAHNVFLQILTEVGIVGFIGFLGWIGCWIYFYQKIGKKADQWVWISLIFLLLGSGISQNSLKDSEVLYTLVFVTQWTAMLLLPKSNLVNDYGSNSSKSKNLEP